MGGKSTYMRQTALITILAHIGSFVPAESASIGPIDRIFTRIGAGDDLARGLSTFMVEMQEAATILKHATKNSLVLIDEIGRGTSTFDGMALAYATARHLALSSQAFTLFATHYFELTALADEAEQIGNIHVEVLEQNGDITFLHQIKPGATSRSYGLHVARLAGLPNEVLTCAEEKLASLHATPQTPLKSKNITEASKAQATAPLLTWLHALDLDELTPRQAHSKLYELKQQLAEKLEM